MYKIDLQDYKGSKVYFQLFDVILKDIPIKKEDYLLENDINPSSYRLARKIEQNIGRTIIEKLAHNYDYIIPSNEEIDNIENNLNQIYEDMYYKIYDNYDKHQSYIDELINKKYIIFPIINLIKLFLNCNNNVGYEKQISDNETLFKEVLKYKNFLNNSLIEIFTIFEIVYQKVDVSYYMMKHYDNALVYFMLASKSLGELKYVECIYFINICKERLIKENNYKRLINLYYKLMQCYLYFRDYEECYNFSKQVLLMCRSFGIVGFEYETPLKNYAVSCIALGKYKEVIQIYEKKESINYNELCYFLVALFETDKEKYNEAISEYTKAANIINDDYVKLILSVINEYNVKGTKKRLDELNEYIMLTFIKILKERK